MTTTETPPDDTADGPASARLTSPNGCRVTFTDSTAWTSPDTRRIRHHEDDVILFDDANKPTALLRWASVKTISILRGRGPHAATE